MEERETQQQRKSLIKKIISDIVEENFQKLCKITCTPEYYENQFLAYAMRHQNSIPCIDRTYAEMLQSCSKNFSHDCTDLNHSLQYIPYLGIYCNDRMLKFISDLCYELRNKIISTFCKKLTLITFNGRLKSTRSLDAKIRSNILKNKNLALVQKNFQEYLKQYQKNILENNPNDEKGKFVFSDKDFDYVNEHLKNSQELLQKEKNISKDSVGYRFIVNNFDHSTAEKDLIAVVYNIYSICIDFFKEHGYDIIKVKDYIRSPKPNHYQSLHFVVLINNIYVEFQLRTAGMNQVAEEGTASYHNIYKDTQLQHFLNDFMYGVSKDLNLVPTHQDIGLLECIPLPRQSISITPLSEIPQTPADLREFRNLALLEKIYAESPKLPQI